jgi:hypothetical protein
MFDVSDEFLQAFIDAVDRLSDVKALLDNPESPKTEVGETFRQLDGACDELEVTPQRPCENYEQCGRSSPVPVVCLSRIAHY